MVKKYMIAIIIVVLMFLFLFAIGDNITGYAVHKNQMGSLDVFPYPFVKNNVYNNLFIVLGDSYSGEDLEAANEVAAALQNTKVVAPKIIKESELQEGIYNLILIGQPCRNGVMAKLLGTNSCYARLNKGDGMLRLFSNDLNSYLVVTGYSGEDVKKAAQVLAYKSFYNYGGSKIIISGNLEAGYLVESFE